VHFITVTDCFIRVSQSLTRWAPKITMGAAAPLAPPVAMPMVVRQGWTVCVIRQGTPAMLTSNGSR